MGPRLGIVGLGKMGTEHAKRVDRTDATVVAGADVSQAAREQFSDRFDADVYADVADLRAGGIDAVIVAVPNAFHEEVAVESLESGHDVYLEKPVAHDLASAERIAAAARRAPGFCTIGFPMRYYPAVTELLDRVATGEIGEIQHVEARYLRRDGVPQRGWFVDPDLAGGGALIDVGVHVIDLALATLGFPSVEGVFGRTWTDTPGLDVPDSAAALAHCSTGATIDIEVSWAAQVDSDRSLVVHGSEGKAHLDLDESALFVAFGSGPEDDLYPVDTPDPDWLAPSIESFVDAVARGEPPRCDIEDGVAVQRVVDAIYRSDETESHVTPLDATGRDSNQSQV